MIFYPPPHQEKYLFIDAGYLIARMNEFTKKYFGVDISPIEYSNISSSFLKTFYYDCEPMSRSGETPEAFDIRLQEKRNSFKKLRKLSGWHVHEGVVKNTGSRPKQKEVDILIAVDMLTHTYRRNMHRATFIAGDQDFRPLVSAVVREGMFLELKYFTTSFSEELVNAADLRTPIGPYEAYEWLTNDFKQSNKLPDRSTEYSPYSGPGTLINEGSTVDGKLIKLFREEDNYVLLHQVAEYPSAYMRMGFSDLKNLLFVHKELYGLSNWRDPMPLP